MIARHDGDDVLLDPVDSLSRHHHVVMVAGVVRGQHGVGVARGWACYSESLVAILQLQLRLIEEQRQHLPRELPAVRADHGEGPTPHPTGMKDMRGNIN